MGTRSEPEALTVMRLLRSFTIHGRVKSISCMDGRYWPSIFGKSPVSSLANREMYWEFKASSTSDSRFTDKLAVSLKNFDVALLMISLKAFIMVMSNKIANM